MRLMCRYDLKGRRHRLKRLLPWDQIAFIKRRLPRGPQSQKHISPLISYKLRIALNALNCFEWNQAELGFGPEWTEVPLNFPSIEMNLTQREYRPVLPAADKWSPACVCVSLVSAVWLVLLGLLLLNVRHIQATHTFGRCRLSGVSALAVEQLSWEMYLCMKRASNTERARWVRTQCFHTQRAM